MRFFGLPLVLVLALPAAGGATFRRGSDILNIGGKSVSKKAIVNVLGRWDSHQDWNGFGRKAQLDEFRSGDYFEEDVQKIATDFSKPMEYYIARRPQFLNFCERYGLVARWVHNDNVGKLPFTDAALAESIGASVEELNAEPVDELAADIVFDALCGSMAGFVDEDQCDTKKAQFFTADGGFDEDSFRKALGETRRNNLGVLTFGPGFGVGVLGLIGYRWLPTLQASTEKVAAKLEATYAADGPLSLVLPLVVVGAFVAQAFAEASSGRGGAASTARPLDWQERAIAKQDELFRERMKLKKRGEGLDDEGTPRIDGTSTGAYFAKLWQLNVQGPIDRLAGKDDASSEGS